VSPGLDSALVALVMAASGSIPAGLVMLRRLVRAVERVAVRLEQADFIQLSRRVSAQDPDGETDPNGIARIPDRRLGSPGAGGRPA
jgi:hypothetical protein